MGVWWKPWIRRLQVLNLDRLGMSDKTIVVFTSEMEGFLPATESDFQLLERRQGRQWEGGIVNFLHQMAGSGAPGSQSDEPAIEPTSITLLEMAGLPARLSSM